MLTFFKLQPLTAAITLAFSSTLAIAHSEHQDEPTLQLAPIVVTAQNEYTEANGLMIHADPKQPIQPIPASDGAAYLKSIAGFNSINSGGTNGDITFRGLFGSRIKVLTDGSENLGACPSRMDAPTSYISPESYDRITVIKGPQTVAYANTGSAATVMFERDVPRFDADKPYQGQASVVIGSFGRIDHNVDVAVGNDHFYSRLNANRSKSNSYQDGDGKTVPSAWEKWNADLTLGWTPDADTHVELKAGKSDGEAEYAGRSMDGTKFARESLGLGYTQENLGQYFKKLEAQIDYSFNDHVMDNFSLRQFTSSDGMSMPMSSNVSRKTINARLAGTYDWHKLSIKSGVDHQYNQHASRSGMSNSYIDAGRSKDMQFQSSGIFTEISYPLHPQYQLVTGIRADHVEVKDLREASKISGYNTRLAKTLPSGFIRLESENSDATLKSYIGLGYVERMPDYWELFSPVHGNAGSSNTFNGVNPEKTTQLDLGLQYEQGALRGWTSIYAGVIQDYILMSYHQHAMGSMSHGISAGAKNVDARIAGAEAGLSYQFTDRILADASLAYAWGENHSEHSALAQIAPLEGRFNLRYVADRYSLGAYLRAVAKQNRIAYHQGNIVGYDLAESKRFSTLSFNGSYRLNSSVDLSVGIDNVLNKTYAEHLNKAGNAGFGYASEEQFNSIGRNYWTRLSMKF
ncbi:MAG: TonB-dependent copper receptor [Acinetobacter populi]|jgi:iron complex outermembrane receptor protein|uniref:TonB-dependent copper receptor n=1 Tax=Acinetobacter populi TaxID=1582270 RepID=UPI0023524167|nr:TonB-dependent copper receptor [Acinetobacter populi]MCH4247208.1 TonB-dependent copper receptor [Acinetobacter populi]